jgi:hypothetical protein
MPDINLTLSTEETDYLLRVLEQSVVHKRVEIHHTDRRAYRHELEHELEVVEALKGKLARAKKSS